MNFGDWFECQIETDSVLDLDSTGLNVPWSTSDVCFEWSNDTCGMYAYLEPLLLEPTLLKSESE